MSNNEDNVNIAEKIRRNFFQLDLRYTEAETQMLIAEEDFKKFHKLGGVNNQKRAQKANIKVRVLKVYMVNIQAIKEASINKLSLILDTYNQKYKDIFIMYFIERKAIEDIAIIAKYNRRHIDRIIAKLKEDLEEIYPPDKK